MRSTLKSLNNFQIDSFILVKIISEAVNKKEKKMNCEKLIF